MQAKEEELEQLIAEVEQQNEKVIIQSKKGYFSKQIEVYKRH